MDDRLRSHIAHGDTSLGPASYPDRKKPVLIIQCGSVATVLAIFRDEASVQEWNQFVNSLGLPEKTHGPS